MANIEKLGNAGIKCDNPECGYVNKETPDEKLSEWLGVPCPDCGQNLLTQEDLDSALRFDKIMGFINSMSEEQLIAFNEAMGVNPEAVKDISSEFTVDIHNGIKIEFKGE